MPDASDEVFLLKGKDLEPMPPSSSETDSLMTSAAWFKKWGKVGWKNVCKLWLEERTPEQLKGEGGSDM